jgi:hypothetical protein
LGVVVGSDKKSGTAGVVVRIGSFLLSRALFTFWKLRLAEQMESGMSTQTKNEIMSKLRRRYLNAGREHKRKLIDEAVALLGYHRKAAIRALRAPAPGAGCAVKTGRPREYDAAEVRPVLRAIWSAANYPCGRRLAGMMADWVASYEAYERSVPAPVREQLLAASPRTLDRLLRPLRVQARRPSLTRPGSLLRHQIPIRGSVWEENKAGWLEVDTVALCGGSPAGDYVWMLDAVDYATTWVSTRAMWNRGQEGTLAALADLERCLPFPLLGLDSDNGGEFLNYHVLAWLQKRPRPVFMTRSRPYKKDDNAHVEQKNWTHVRHWFGYERHDNHEVVEPLNALARGPLHQLLNFFHASLKLEHKERTPAGKIRRVYKQAQTPLQRVLARPEIPEKDKAPLRAEKARLNAFALKAEVDGQLRQIAALRRPKAVIQAGWNAK